MNSSPSWHRVVPRLLTVVVALLAVQYLVGQAARTMAIRYGEALTSARVDVAHARVALLDHTVVLSGLQIADPSRPDEARVSADVCELPVALQPLLHKQAVVNRGRIRGLRIAPIAATAASHDTQNQWFNAAADQPVRDWLVRLSKSFECELLNRLPSVTRTVELCGRWPAESATLDTRGQELERRASELGDAVEAAQTNPLRSDKFLQELPVQLAALQQDFAAFGADIKNLPDSLDAERRAIVAARRDDEKMLRDGLGLAPIDSAALSTYLLRNHVAAQLDELLGWLHWARQVVPAARGQASNTQRGEEILFAGCRPVPGVLFKSLLLQGSTRIGGQPLEFCGTLGDLASTPALHNAPIRLHLSTTGSLSLDVQAMIDRTTREPRDTLLVECQGLVLPEQTWGGTEQLRMKLAPSIAAMNMNISLIGDALTGDIQLLQNELRMTSMFGGDSSHALRTDAMSDTLARVNSLSTRISLAGSLDNPTCQLSSNAGEAVADAVARSYRRIHDARVVALLAEAGRRVDEQLATLERKVSDQQAKLASHSTSVSDNLQRIATGTSPRHRMSDEKVGRRLPDTSLFR